MEEPPPEDRVAPRRRMAARVAAGAIVLALGALWVDRRPIAEGFVDRALAQRGVPARYRIVTLGLGRQELADVSIGDPARPDLTAKRVVLTLAMGLHGPEVAAIAADGVRLRGRLAGGALRLGAVDRLLPAGSGGPLALPDLTVALNDARMRLETPAGVVGLALTGQGNLADGFEGRIAARAHRLALGGCRIDAPGAVLNVAIARRRPALDGPLGAVAVACGGVTIARPQFALDTLLAPSLDAWDGTALADLAGIAAPGVRLGRAGGRIGFRGDAARTTGTLQLTAGDARAASAAAATVALDGRYLALGHAGAARFEGQARAGAMTGSPAALAAIARSLRGFAGTPFGPLGDALARSVAEAARGVDAQADLAVQVRGRAGALRIARLGATSRSGARLEAASAQGFALSWPGGAMQLGGGATLAGGGFPSLMVALRQPAAGAPFAGEITMAPYAVPGARLALAPVRFAAVPRATTFATTATLDGPLGDGSVRALRLPLTGRIGAGGAFVLNEGCVPLGFDALSIAELTVTQTRVPLCPSGGALVSRAAGGAIAGGGGIAGPVLRGRLGGMPVTIAARSLGFTVGSPGFAAESLVVRLGAGDAVSRLDIARLEGAFAQGGVGGRFTGLGGQIARVPLILSEGAGPWRLAGGVLDLGGGVRVADEAAPPRFEPLVSDDLHLRLAGGRIVAGGWLKAPKTGTRITEVAIRHDLRSGIGDATLAVPGIAFTDTLQPEALTRLTLGVVANVRGTVAGEGHIAWGPQGVTSGGTFATPGTDLAAAFGPVKGIRTTVHFTDLLGLVSAPAQEATVAEVNPGIAVTGGIVRYRLLPLQQVAVESARWPFSGGELVLEPTVLDFAETATRRMTFRVTGMDAAQFVQQFDFKNVDVTGVFDGTVPIVFDAKGGRIEGGHLAVRQSGGTLAYVGEISNKDLGLFGSLAFDALKRMRYERLAIGLDGSLDGEIVSRVLFDGTNETPKAAVRRHGLLSQFSNLPFRFRITIRAPFRGLLNSARSLNDPRGLIDQALPPAPAAPALPGSAPPPAEPTPIQSR